MAKNEFDTNSKNAQDAKNTKGKDKQEQDKYTTVLQQLLV